MTLKHMEHMEKSLTKKRHSARQGEMVTALQRLYVRKINVSSFTSGTAVRFEFIPLHAAKLVGKPVTATLSQEPG